MTLRSSGLLFFTAYALLSTYILARSVLGLPFQVWSGFLHPVLAFLFTVTHAAPRFGRGRTALFLGITLLLTLGVEMLGVATGFPFGRYHYTDRLGPLLLGLVPYLIPISWVIMLYPSLVIATRILPAGSSRWGWRLGVAALAATALTAWDLVVDPVMVSRQHWVWEQPGPYFGIPLSNYFGWWLTGFTVAGLFLWLGNVQPGEPPRLPGERLAVWLYALTAAVNIASAVKAGLEGAALAAGFAMLPWVIVGLLRTSPIRVTHE